MPWDPYKDGPEGKLNARERLAIAAVVLLAALFVFYIWS